MHQVDSAGHSQGHLGQGVSPNPSSMISGHKSRPCEPTLRKCSVARWQTELPLPARGLNHGITLRGMALPRRSAARADIAAMAFQRFKSSSPANLLSDLSGLVAMATGGVFKQTACENLTLPERTPGRGERGLRGNGNGRKPLSERQARQNPHCLKPEGQPLNYPTP